MTRSNDLDWVRLGDYIEAVDERNSEGKFHLEDVKGMTITKEIIPTKANLTGNDLQKFLVVNREEFVYNPRTHGKKIGLGYNDTGKPFLISWNNIAFRIKDKSKLLPLYLYMHFNRDEWDRQACYNSWGSSTEVFSWYALCDMMIPLPSIERQREIVDTWQGLRKMKEENEAIAAPLLQLCQSYIQDLKHKYPMIELGDNIEEITRTNAEGKFGFEDVRGVSNAKTMRDYKGSLAGRNVTKFLLIEENEFVFNKRTNAGMGLCLVKDRPYLFTEDYEAFRVVDKNKLLPDFLYLFFIQKDFDRYILFNSWGSSVIFFHIDDMKHFRLPIPPVEIQQAVVDIYRCANEAKQIAEEADRLSHDICPALMQHVIHENQ